VAKAARKRKRRGTGKLRIGDSWNAITIIASSQSNPFKAVSEFVENSIDAGAKNIFITRGKKQGAFCLKIADDGEGIPRDDSGLPDFHYVATHICDSIKRRLKAQGVEKIQGEFGIGLLSFWTVGENLRMTSSGEDGNTYQMLMAKGSQEFTVSKKRVLFPTKGTMLEINPLLPGLRSFTGEKIQRYLASELRDRIRDSSVDIKVIDRTARREYVVVPRQFKGRLLHDLQPVDTEVGDIYLELYLNTPDSVNQVGLYRRGTRVLPSITELDPFQKAPWNSGYLQGIVDAHFLNLTPGTRHGVIRDERFEAFCLALEPVEKQLQKTIEEQRRAEEERSSRQTLRKVQRALREAFLYLPKEEYDWFDIHGGRSRKKTGAHLEARLPNGSHEYGEQGDMVSGVSEHPQGSNRNEGQKAFFEFAGPLFSVMITPKTSVVSIDKQKKFRALCRDRARRTVLNRLVYRWEITDGEGELDQTDGQTAIFTAPAEPCLTTLRVIVRQDEIEISGEALITITDTLIEKPAGTDSSRKGLPGYTFRRAPGEMWRSQFDTDKNVIIINKGHRDFVYAGKQKSRKLRYVCRLFCKELLLHNYPGLKQDELLERMIELSMYTEEHLK
jgi:hypothetical protein